MKEFTGEPGPWILGGCSGRMITTKDGYVGNGFIADVDTLANARLIAAAPELLEALQKILSSAYEIEHDFYGLPGGEDFDISQVIKDAQSAINKALGETK